METHPKLGDSVYIVEWDFNGKWNSHYHVIVKRFIFAGLKIKQKNGEEKVYYYLKSADGRVKKHRATKFQYMMFTEFLPDKHKLMNSLNNIMHDIIQCSKEYQKMFIENHKNPFEKYAKINIDIPKSIKTYAIEFKVDFFQLSKIDKDADSILYILDPGKQEDTKNEEIITLHQENFEKMIQSKELCDLSNEEKFHSILDDGLHEIYNLM